MSSCRVTILQYALVAISLVFGNVRYASASAYAELKITTGKEQVKTQFHTVFVILNQGHFKNTLDSTEWGMVWCEIEAFTQSGQKLFLFNAEMYPTNPPTHYLCTHALFTCGNADMAIDGHESRNW